MKLPSVLKPRATGASRPPRAQAFTLPEMMIAVLVFIMMILALIGVWMFGLRWDQLVCSKLGASEKSRIGFDTLTTDIRAAKMWRIGTNGTKTTFSPLANQANLVGNQEGND